MRYVNVNVLSDLATDDINGDQIDSNQLISGSFHLVTSEATESGTFKLQASNDVPPNGKTGPNAGQFVVTNWVDIPNQSASITSGGDAILTLAQMSYRWVRAVFDSTAAAAQLEVQDLTYTAVV